MNVIVLSASPNLDGLTAACAAAAVEGARQAGAQAQEVRLNDAQVGMCEACDNGWGTCLKDHECQVEDGYQALHARVLEAGALIFVTPVYWGELAEAAKAFADRIRRCEATKGYESGLAGVPVIVVAAAGGSGNGMITCLLSMERWIGHLRARKFDLITVNRSNRAYKVDAIRHAAAAMVKDTQAQTSVRRGLRTVRRGLRTVRRGLRTVRRGPRGHL